MRCPECGTPVAQSLYGNWLRLADPQLKLGAAFKLWGLLVGFFVGAGAAIAIIGGLPTVVVFILSAAGGIFTLAAIFLITSPEPTIGKAEDPITLRKVVRLCAVLGFFGGQLAQGLRPWVAHPVVLVGGHALTIASIVAMFGEFVYLRRFAQRIPDLKLAKRTTVVMWGFGAGTIASFILGVTAAIFAATTAPPPAPPPATAPASGRIVTTSITVMAPSPTPAGVPTTATAVGATSTTAPGTIALIGFFGCFAGVAFLVFGVLYVILLFRYHRAFKQAAAEAELIARGELPLFQLAPNDARPPHPSP